MALRRTLGAGPQVLAVILARPASTVGGKVLRPARCAAGLVAGAPRRRSPCRSPRHSGGVGRPGPGHPDGMQVGP